MKAPAGDVRDFFLLLIDHLCRLSSTSGSCTDAVHALPLSLPDAVQDKAKAAPAPAPAPAAPAAATGGDDIEMA